MPSLHWIGKADVERHIREIPTRLLRCDRDLSHGDPAFDPSPGTGNLLIEGDNLLALKALLPYYKNQVKCIYIDPPYNTGNEGWIYNDNVNSPQIRAWLGKVVDGEDLCRHDKWLCMMRPRLEFHQQLLREDGAIFISIDDNEVHHLRALCDEIFGASNFIGTIAWQKKYAVSNDHKGISPMHDFIIGYAKSPKFERNLLARTEKNDKQYRFSDDKGVFRIADYTCNKTAEERPNLYYAIYNPNTGRAHWPSRTRVWAYAQERHHENELNGLIWWGKDGQGAVPAFKRYRASLRGGGGSVPSTWWTHEEVGHNDEARKEVREFELDFSTPKPTRLIERILQIATNPGDIVLDSFAGSGTTGHAVLKMNAQNPDVAPRRFVLVEMEPQIARPITRERLTRAINGYGKHEPLGDGFRFCHLGEPILDPEGGLNPRASWRDLAHFFYLDRFQTALDGSQLDPQTGFVGKAGSVSLYLLFDEKGVAPLDSRQWKRLNEIPGPKIVYCECVGVPPAMLERAQIVAFTVPYEVAL